MNTDNMRAVCAAWDIDYERLTEAIDDVARNGVPENSEFRTDTTFKIDFSNAREAVHWLVSVAYVTEKARTELEQRIALATLALGVRPTATGPASPDKRE